MQTLYKTAQDAYSVRQLTKIFLKNNVVVCNWSDVFYPVIKHDSYNLEDYDQRIRLYIMLSKNLSKEELRMIFQKFYTRAVIDYWYQQKYFILVPVTLSILSFFIPPKSAQLYHTETMTTFYQCTTNSVFSRLSNVAITLTATSIISFGIFQVLKY